MKLYELVIKNPKITSKFGYRIHPITKKRTFHYGLDLISKDGNKNLFAVDDGYVQKVRKGNTGYGNYIWIRYPRYNLSLLYAHCSSIKKKKGDKVKKGQVVAIEGKSGASTGIHLHLGMTKIGSNTWLNPEKYNVLSDKFNLTRVLKKGCKGEDVGQLQKELKVKQTKLFGNTTLKKVKEYQKNKKLKADGIVGRDTAHALGWLYKDK